MAKTMDDILAAIREFYHSPDVDPEEHKKLWAVLTALRGPDEETIREESGYMVKAVTTGVIRGRVLGLSCDAVRAYASVFADSAREAREIRLKVMPEWFLRGDYKRTHHFLVHARNAFDALGLKWDENNDAPTEFIK